MNYLTNDLAAKCNREDKMSEANRIIISHLGRDENSQPRTLAQATPEMIGALETIVVDLEHLLGIR